MSTIAQFHLAFPVRDLDEARHFYGELMGCPQGRSDTTYQDFDFFGHHLVAHISGDGRHCTADASTARRSRSRTSA